MGKALVIQGTILLLVLVTIAASAFADTEQEAKRAIQAQYARMNQAMMQKDIKALAKVFASNGVLKEDEGKTLTVSKWLLQVKQLFPQVRMSSASTRIVAIKLEGDTCVVAAIWSGLSRFVKTRDSDDDFDTKPYRVSQMLKDTWKKTGASWQITLRSIGMSTRKPAQ